MLRFGLFLFVVFLSLEFHAVESESITLYQLYYQKGLNRTVDATNDCADIPSQIFKVRSIDTNGSCVYIWDGKGCTGKHIKSFLYSQSGNRIASITPRSYQLCGDYLTRSAVIYKAQNYTGQNLTIYVPGNGSCYQIPSEFANNIASVAPVRYEYCFIFWKGPSCTSDTGRKGIRIRKAYKSSKDLVSNGWSKLIGSAQLCRGVDRGCGPPPSAGPRPTTDEELRIDVGTSDDPDDFAETRYPSSKIRKQKREF